MHTAKLVWVTPDAEKLIGKLARVSNSANEDNPNVEGLIKYLIKHKHWSPFEMASMCVEIQTTRAISPQILRHRSFSFQEFSQRYSQVQELTIPKLRSQDTKNRQNSVDDISPELQRVLEKKIDENNSASLDLYNYLLAAGVAKECARDVLPTNAKTRLYMSGTIRSWLHYIDLRASHGTQVEHSQIAKQIGEILDTELPTVSRAMWT